MTPKQATILILVVPAVVLLLVLLLTAPGQDLVVRLFGPPRVESHEEYAGETATSRFDHGRLDAVLARFVTRDGRVDYDALVEDRGELDAYVASLAGARYDTLGRDGKLALLINAYNACTLRLILDHWPIASIKDIPSAQRWNDRRWKVGNLTLSLAEIENDYLRRRFEEPRVHFAINCASVGCPPLRREAFTPEKLEAQLADQGRRVHRQGSRWFRLDGDRVHLTELYRWFAGDFERAAGSVLSFAARFSPELAARIEAGRTPHIRWIDYDWSLNRKL